MGKDLLTTIASATGLPSDLVMAELLRLVEKSGKSAEDLSLEELRAILADFLQDVLLQTKQRLDEFDELGN
jgi:hypothetical protein